MREQGGFYCGFELENKMRTYLPTSEEDTFMQKKTKQHNFQINNDYDNIICFGF